VVVGEAEDGESALALTAELSPDLVLLDIQLPDISGFEVVSRLHEKHPELEVVLISSRDQNAYGSSLGASGALGFITKGELSGPALVRVADSAAPRAPAPVAPSLSGWARDGPERPLSGVLAVGIGVAALAAMAGAVYLSAASHHAPNPIGHAVLSVVVCSS